MAFIVSLIQSAIVEDLEAAFVGTTSPATVGQIVLGRLMADPEGEENPIEVHENDPDNPEEWTHQQCTSLPGWAPAGSPTSTHDIGGGETWVRRFTVKLNIFLTREGLERNEAIEVMNTVHGIAMHALRNSTRIPGLTDEYGETVWMVRHCIAKSEMSLGGGPPTSWIGRGKLWVQVWSSLE